jgi:hypothetical protein
MRRLPMLTIDDIRSNATWPPRLISLDAYCDRHIDFNTFAWVWRTASPT